MPLLQCLSKYHNVMLEDQLNSISDEIREEMKKKVNDLQEEMKLLLRPGHTPSHPVLISGNIITNLLLGSK